MVHHLWYGTFDAEAEDARERPRAEPQRPASRRPAVAGARRAVGKALIDIGERIASDQASNSKAAGE